MAACPNCAHPLDASAACSACNQERPPTSDALLTPGPAANKDRRRTLLALAPFLLLTAAAFLGPDLLLVASASLGLDLEEGVTELISFGVAAMGVAAWALWFARIEPPRLRWGPNLDRLARRRDLAWMVFAIALGNSVVASTMYWCLVYWRPSDGFWSSGLGNLISTYYGISGLFGLFGIMIGLASVVWRLEVAARRRDRTPNRWLARIAMASLLLAMIVNLALAIMLLVPSVVFAAFSGDPAMKFNKSMEFVEAVLLLIGGLLAIAAVMILSMLPPALRSPRQQPSAA